MTLLRPSPMTSEEERPSSLGENLTPCETSCEFATARLVAPCVAHVYDWPRRATSPRRL